MLLQESADFSVTRFRKFSKLLDQAVMMAAEQDEGNEENFCKKAYMQ